MPSQQPGIRSHPHHSSLTVTWLWSVIALGLIVLLGPPAHASAAPEEGVEEAKAAVAKATAAFAAGDFAAAATAYREAIEARIEVYADEEDDQAAAFRRMGRSKAVPAQELVDKLPEMLVRRDELGNELAGYEYALARAEARAGRTPEAVRALGRALSYRLELESAIPSDKHFDSVRKGHDYEELMLRLKEGRLHLVGDEPLIDEIGRRDFKRRLALEPGNPRLEFPTPLLRAMRKIATRRHDAEAPAELTLKNYAKLTRLGLLLPHSHYGWAYRHSHLFEGGAAIARLQADALGAYTDKKADVAGLFWGLLAYYPSLHQGHLTTVRSLLTYFKKRSLLRYDGLLHGTIWVLKSYLDGGATLPGTTRADCRKLLAEAEAARKTSQFDLTRQRAWQGYPFEMAILAGLYRSGTGVKRNDARAYVWAKGSHEQDDIRGTTWLAIFTSDGIGTPKDVVRGTELYIKAARGGGLFATNQVGYNYQYGLGVELDYEEAIEWFEKAAAKGHAMAMESLGMLYQRGLGTEQDYDAAHTWYEKCKAAGNDRGLRRLGNLAIDTRTGMADVRNATADLDGSIEKFPGDILSVIYAWVALQLQDDLKAARALAKVQLGGKAFTGLDRELLRAMAASKIGVSRVLSKIKKEADEEKRQEALGRIHYLAGIQMIAKGKPPLARKHFEKAVKDGLEIGSTRYSAMAELKRLEAAGK